MKNLFYTGSYAPQGEAGIRAFSIEMQTGHTELLAVNTEVENPSYLTLNADGTRLYAVSETENHGAVYAFCVEKGGALRLMNTASVRGGLVCHLAVDPAQRYLAAAGFESGDVDLFRLQADGSVGPHIFSERHAGKGPHPQRQASAHAHFVSFRPEDPDELFTVDLGTDRIDRYRIKDSAVERLEAIVLPAGGGARHLVWNAQCPGLFYVVCEIRYQVHTLCLSGDGAERLDSVSCMPDGFDAFGGSAAIRLSPDGTRLYVSNRVLEPPAGRDCITCYSLDQKGMPGEPVFVQTGAVPRDFRLFDDWMAVACQADGRLEIRPMGANGLPGAVREQQCVPGVCCVTSAIPFA